MSATGHTLTLLGGAGRMGVGIARDLLSELTLCPIREIRLADVSAERIDRALSALDGIAQGRLVAWPLDVTQPSELQRALAASDLCINAVPTLAGHQMTIFEASLMSRCDYIDLGGLGVVTVEQLNWRERFHDTGVTAILGAGGDPGLSNMLCRAVADRLDTIESIKLYWAAELVGDENPLLVPPYSISTVLAEYARPSTQFLDGQHVQCEPRGGLETLELPEPWGETDFIYSPHSEPLTVPLSAGIADKGIQEFTWKLHLPHREHEAWLGLVKAGFGDFDEPVNVGGVDVDPVAFLEALVTRNIDRHGHVIPEQDSHEIHLAIGTGTVSDERRQVRAQVEVHPDPAFDDYVDAGTSMNASIAAQLMLTNRTPRPGVWAPEEWFDVEPYFREVERRGMRYSISTTSLIGADR